MFIGNICQIEACLNPPPLLSGTYIPRKEVAVLETIKATVIRENQAIRLRARKEGVDRGGVRRVTGERHLLQTRGINCKPSMHKLAFVETRFRHVTRRYPSSPIYVI